MIHRLNWWYDDLEEPLRFLVFFIPFTIITIMAYWPGRSWVNIVGLAGLCILAGLRVYPIFVKRSRD